MWWLDRYLALENDLYIILIFFSYEMVETNWWNKMVDTSFDIIPSDQWPTWRNILIYCSLKFSFLRVYFHNLLLVTPVTKQHNDIQGTYSFRLKVKTFVIWYHISHVTPDHQTRSVNPVVVNFKCLYDVTLHLNPAFKHMTDSC